jgi:opacity protein-like surface antigen
MQILSSKNISFSLKMLFAIFAMKIYFGKLLMRCSPAQCLAYILLYCMLSLNLFADAAVYTCSWHPIFTGRAGILVVSNAGQSKTFPITDPVTEERYAYKPNHKTQTRFFAGVFAGVEGELLDNFSVQCGLNYNQAASFLIHGTFTQGTDMQSENRYSYRYKARIRQLLAEGKLLYKGLKYVRPYLSLGLGASFNQAYNYLTSVPPTLTFTRMYRSHTTSSFAYSLGLGFDFDIVDSMRFEIGYSFSDFGKVCSGAASIDGISVKGTLSQQHFYANGIFGGFTYVF